MCVCVWGGVCVCVCDSLCFCMCLCVCICLFLCGNFYTYLFLQSERKILRLHNVYNRKGNIHQICLQQQASNQRCILAVAKKKFTICTHSCINTYSHSILPLIGKTEYIISTNTIRIMVSVISIYNLNYRFCNFRPFHEFCTIESY